MTIFETHNKCIVRMKSNRYFYIIKKGHCVLYVFTRIRSSHYAVFWLLQKIHNFLKRYPILEFCLKDFAKRNKSMIFVVVTLLQIGGKKTCNPRIRSNSTYIWPPMLYYMYSTYFWWDDRRTLHNLQLCFNKSFVSENFKVESNLNGGTGTASLG